MDDRMMTCQKSRQWNHWMRDQVAWEAKLKDGKIFSSFQKVDKRLEKLKKCQLKR